MSDPVVSVVMSAYNAEAFLAEAVESVLGQTFRDFEFVIIDDGSTDGTGAMLKSYAARDTRIVLIENGENRGLIYSLNRGLEMAHGRYVARQDADDISLAERLEKQVAFLDARPEVVAVAAEMFMIDTDGRWFSTSRRQGDSSYVAWHLLFRNYFCPHSAVTFRNAVVRRIGGYNKAFQHCEDYELWTRLAEAGELVILPDTLLRHRVHQESISHIFVSAQNELGLDISARALGQLLGTDISRDRAKALRAFWTGPFPEPSMIPRFHRILTQAYRAFVRRRQETWGLTPRMAAALRRSVADRFFDWTRTLAVRRRLWEGLRAFVHGLLWDPWRGVSRIATYAWKRIHLSHSEQTV